jgi:hypothetical protein
MNSNAQTFCNANIQPVVSVLVATFSNTPLEWRGHQTICSAGALRLLQAPGAVKHPHLRCVGAVDLGGNRCNATPVKLRELTVVRSVCHTLMSQRDKLSAFMHGNVPAYLQPCSQDGPTAPLMFHSAVSGHNGLQIFHYTYANAPAFHTPLYVRHARDLAFHECYTKSEVSFLSSRQLCAGFGPFHPTIAALKINYY